MKFLIIFASLVVAAMATPPYGGYPRHNHWDDDEWRYGGYGGGYVGYGGDFGGHGGHMGGGFIAGGGVGGIIGGGHGVHGHGGYPWGGAIGGYGYRWYRPHHQYPQKKYGHY